MNPHIDLFLREQDARENDNLKYCCSHRARYGLPVKNLTSYNCSEWPCRQTCLLYEDEVDCDVDSDINSQYIREQMEGI